jgi:hypothetical protein
MPSDEALRCRICGLKLDVPPWGDDGRTPSFEFCPCCGVEWGYQDATAVGARRYREQWLKAGAAWESPELRPAHWDLQAQLMAIPTGFR